MSAFRSYLFWHQSTQKQVRTAIITSTSMSTMTFTPIAFECLCGVVGFFYLHESLIHLIELPGSALVLSANPNLSFSTSNMPKNEVKKAPPSTTVFLL